jgi:acetyltransferase
MWSRGNPVDIIGDADGDRYAAALKAVEADPGVDAVLTIHCPTAVVSPTEAASGVITRGPAAKPALACWMGDFAGREARAALTAAGIPTFTQPESAVTAFMHLVEARRQRERLIAADAASPTVAVDRTTTNRLLVAALESGREWLDEVDAKGVLTAYGIPVARSVKTADPADVARAAAWFEGPVAVKIRSPDLPHKTDLGGVALDLGTPLEAREAAEAMLATVRQNAPKARLEGFVVEEMVSRLGSFELIAGLSSDATFGPAVVFGHGGVAVSQIGDTAIALPPLTRHGAAELVGATHVARQLRGGRGRKPVNLAAVEDVLLRLARLALDHPEIVELDINPLLVDADGAVALDARIRVRDPSFAVLPACWFPPHQGERHIACSDGADILIRPLRVEDAPALQHFVETLDPATIRGRFFEMIRRLPAAMLDRLTQIDFDREAAFVAIDRTANPDDDVVCGVGRLIVLPGDRKAEYALTVSSEMMDKGIGRALMDELILFAKRRGLNELCGTELIESTALIDLAHQSGGVVTQDREDPSVACIALKLVPFARAA